MRLITIINIFIAIIFTSLAAKAQYQEEFLLKKKITNLIFENIDASKIIDSAAIYTFCVKIAVDLKNGKQIVDVDINNPIVSKFYSSSSDLKTVNYAPLLKKRKSATFVCPVFILVFTSHKNEKKISTSAISDAMEYLVMEGMQNYDVWNMISIKYDKNTY